jgi:hypothetical protein
MSMGMGPSLSLSQMDEDLLVRASVHPVPLCLLHSIYLNSAGIAMLAINMAFRAISGVTLFLWHHHHAGPPLSPSAHTNNITPAILACCAQYRQCR